MIQNYSQNRNRTKTIDVRSIGQAKIIGNTLVRSLQINMAEIIDQSVRTLGVELLHEVEIDRRDPLFLCGADDAL